MKLQLQRVAYGSMGYCWVVQLQGAGWPACGVRLRRAYKVPPFRRPERSGMMLAYNVVASRRVAAALLGRAAPHPRAPRHPAPALERFLAAVTLSGRRCRGLCPSCHLRFGRGRTPGKATASSTACQTTCRFARSHLAYQTEEQ